MGHTIAELEQQDIVQGRRIAALRIVNWPTWRGGIDPEGQVCVYPVARYTCRTSDRVARHKSLQRVGLLAMALPGD